jgi:hypothetical protein
MWTRLGSIKPYGITPLETTRGRFGEDRDVYTTRHEQKHAVPKDCRETGQAKDSGTKKTRTTAAGMVSLTRNT